MLRGKNLGIASSDQDGRHYLYALPPLLQGFDANSVESDAQPPLLIWAATEGWVVIIVGCIPPVRPLLERILRKFNLVTTKSTSQTHKYGGTHVSNNHVHIRSANRTFDHSNSGTPSDDVSWVELTKVERGSESREELRPGPREVMVTTEIDMFYDDAQSHGRGSRGATRRDEAEMF